MPLKLASIKHETKLHFAVEVAKGFEVYRIGATCSTRCAFIGFTGQAGLDRAIAEIKRREAK